MLDDLLTSRGLAILLGFFIFSRKLPNYLASIYEAEGHYILRFSLAQAFAQLANATQLLLGDAGLGILFFVWHFLSFSTMLAIAGDNVSTNGCRRAAIVAIAIYYYSIAANWTIDDAMGFIQFITSKLRTIA